MKSPIVSIAGVELAPRPAEFAPQGATAERFDARFVRLGATMGLAKLGVGVTAVAPGKAAFPFHSHQANDELFYVLAGQGELRLGGARHAVTAGDLVACPAGGADSAHQLVNTGDGELRYLAISTMIAPEICEYPDSGKVGAYGVTPAGRYAHLTRLDAAVGYWLGE
jgi:uncharacterized cupin superfamily protein